MIIGVISDTHKEIGYIRKAMEKLKNVDTIIHLGDNIEDVEEIERFYKGTIINVKGNCDYSNEVQGEINMVLGGKRLFITHGHRYGVKENLSRLRSKAIELGADLVLYGHTHISMVEFEEGIFFVNPGSTTFPNNGYHSVAIIEINGDKINPTIINI